MCHQSLETLSSFKPLLGHFDQINRVSRAPVHQVCTKQAHETSTSLSTTGSLATAMFARTHPFTAFAYCSVTTEHVLVVVQGVLLNYVSRELLFAFNQQFNLARVELLPCTDHMMAHCTEQVGQSNCSKTSRAHAHRSMLLQSTNKR